MMEIFKGHHKTKTKNQRVDTMTVGHACIHVLKLLYIMLYIGSQTLIWIKSYFVKLITGNVLTR